MAISEHIWQAASVEQIEKAVRWGQNTLNLRDWDVILETDESPPKEVESDGSELAKTATWAAYLKAMIWLPLGKLKAKDVNPYQTLFHEMLHIMTDGYGSVDTADGEMVSYRMEVILYRLFCRERRLKITKEKDY